MKRSIAAAALCIMAVIAFAGCNKEKEEAGSETGKYVTLGEYKGLTVTVNDTTVTDEDVEKAVENALSSRKTKEEVTGRPVQEGDIANIDYEGKKDGVAFQGGTAQGFDLTIGSGTFIQGFEDGLIGAEVGETRDLNLTFPEDYHSEELAGADVVFTVKVNSISEEVYPELTDELAKELDSSAGSAEEFRENLRKKLQADKGSSAKSQAYAELLTKAQDNATITEGEDLPDDMIEQNKKTQKESFERSLEMYGMDLSTYLAQQGMTEADFDETLEAYARTIAEQQLLINALAEAENITVTDEDIEKQYEEDAGTYGYSSAEEFKKSVAEQGAEETFKEATLTRKVEEMLFKYAKVTNPEMVCW